MILFSEFPPSVLKTQLKSGLAGIEQKFTKGEIVKGTVIKNLANGGLLIRLKGLELIASVPKTLTKGEAILVAVEALKPQFKVSLLTNETAKEAKTTSLLRFYLPQIKDAGELLSETSKLLSTFPKSLLKDTGIEELMAKLTKGVDGAGGKDKGENLLRLFGLSHEADLASGKPVANLKMSILLLIQKIENLPEGERKNFGKKVDKLKKVLHNIELRQFVNSDDEKKIKEWDIPFWNGEKLSSVKFFVEKKNRKKTKEKKDELTKLTLLLKMSRLGSVKVKARALGKEINGSIYVATDDVKKEMQGKLTDLSKRLESVGFSSSFDIVKAKKKFLTQEPDEGKQLPVKSLLHVRA